MINIQTLLSPRASVGYVIHSSFACVRNSCTLCLGSDPEFNRRALLSLSEGLQDKINLIVHHIIKTLTTVERSVELTLTRFAILRGYLAMNAKYGYVDGCVEVGPGHALRHTAPTACAPFFLWLPFFTGLTGVLEYIRLLARYAIILRPKSASHHFAKPKNSTR